MTYREPWTQPDRRWLDPFRSRVDEIQKAAQTTARIVDRYVAQGRPVPEQLYLSRRYVLTELIAQHHHLGDPVIRAARFAIDALDHNQTNPSPAWRRCGECGNDRHGGGWRRCYSDE